MSCGTRGQEFRPGDPDGARLLRSSLLINYSLTETANCWYCKLLVTSNSATLRQPAPSPVLRLLWLRTPLPNHPVRAPAADAFTEVLLNDLTAGYCELALTRTATAVLLVAAPDHCGPPGPVVSPVAVAQQELASKLHHRTVMRVLLPGSSCLPGPSRSRLREKP